MAYMKIRQRLLWAAEASLSINWSMLNIYHNWWLWLRFLILISYWNVLVHVIWWELI